MSEFTPEQFQQVSGQSGFVSGKMLQGVIAATQSSITVFNYDNTYPGATGETLIVSGVIELS